MKYKSLLSLFIAAFVMGVVISCNQSQEKAHQQTVVADRPILPSWTDGERKQAIIDYVMDVTDPQSPHFIPIPDRIATFDNDGTLWSEQPMYFQLFFALDRIKALAAEHPEWKNKQPYKSVLENDLGALMRQGEKGLYEILLVTHTGYTTAQFDSIVNQWMAVAEHPMKKKKYAELVFQPMLELLDYLRSNDFQTFIVSGGSIEFMRPWAEGIYGIPKNQIVGSYFQSVYDYNNGNPTIKRMPKMELNDDKEGKPIGIDRFIGRKPVFVAGNSDGDLQMMRWADSNKFKTFKLYVHHTDSIREWAYDRQSHIGKFNIGLDEALQKGWTIVDMKNDWSIIYPFEKK